MALALDCSWSVLSLCILLGCRLVRSLCGDLRRCQTVAPSANPPCPRQEEKWLHTCWSAAAAAAITTVVFYWSSLRHLVALPPTPRRCYRSTSNASQIRLAMIVLIVSFFLPVERSAAVETQSSGPHSSHSKITPPAPRNCNGIYFPELQIPDRMGLCGNLTVLVSAA